MGPVWTLLAILHLASANSAVPTKLCLNPACTEPAFTTTTSRSYEANDPRFLGFQAEENVKVVGFKYSRMDSFLVEKDGTTGWIYSGFLSLEPYVFFLESALKKNTKLYLVEHHDQMDKKNSVIKEVDSNPELFRDYEVYAKKFEIPVDDIPRRHVEDPNSDHGHSHAHGHSHSHGHSHESMPTTTPGPVTTTAALVTTTAAVTTTEHSANSLTSSPIPTNTDLPKPTPTLNPYGSAKLASVESSQKNVPTEELKGSMNQQQPNVPLGTDADVKQTTTPAPTNLEQQSVSTQTSTEQATQTTTPQAPQTSNEEETQTDKSTLSASQAPTTTTITPIKIEIQHKESTQTTPAPPVTPPVYIPPVTTTTPPVNLDIPTVEPVAVTPPPEAKHVDVHQDISTKPPEIVETPTAVTLEPVTATSIPLTTTAIPEPVNMEMSAEHNIGGKEFCYKDDCSDSQNSEGLAEKQQMNVSEDGVIRSTFKSIINDVRTMLPSPLSRFDDTGIVVLIYTVVAVIIYLVGLALSDKRSPDAFDRRALYDAHTRIKEQATEIENLKRQAPSGEQIAQLNQLEHTCQQQEQHIQQLRAQIVDPVVLQQKDRRIAELESDLHQVSTQKDEAQRQLLELRQNRDALEEKIGRMNEEHRAVEKKLKNRILHLDTDRTESLNKLQQLELILPDTEAKLAALDQELAEARAARDELQTENESLSKLVVDLEAKSQQMEARKSADPVDHDPHEPEEHAESGESGASGGWSDVGNDVDLEHELQQVQPTKAAPSQPHPVVKQADIKALAKANAEISRLKEEKLRLEHQLAAETKDKARLEERINELSKEIVQLNAHIDRAQQEVEAKKQEVQKLDDARRAEAAKREDQFHKLEEAMDRARENLDQIAALKAELNEVDAERKQKELAIRDFEQKLKKADEYETKLKNRMFHEERDYLKKIKLLEEKVAELHTQIATAKPMEPNASSQNLFGSPQAGDLPSLWSPFNNASGNVSIDESGSDLPGRADPRRRSVREASPTRSIGSQGQMPAHVQKRAALANREALEQGRGTAGRRLRSRSAGRYPRDLYMGAPVPMPAPPASGRHSATRSGHVSPATSLLLHGPASTAHHAHHQAAYYTDLPNAATLPRPASGGRLPKVASNLSNLYYSSDGSNGPRSPPPDLVHKSGVPPVQQMPRPVTVRAVKVHPPKPQRQ